MPQAVLAIPKWEPKDRMAPLKEEYLQFYREVTRYHNRIEGYLIDDEDLAERVPEMPEPLNSFAERMGIVLAAANLLPILSDLWSVFDKVRQRRADCTERAEHASTIASGSPIAPSHSTLKVALPNHFDRSTSAILTFLLECNTYIRLNATHFPTDSVKIQWTLQMCSGKAAN